MWHNLAGWRQSFRFWLAVIVGLIILLVAYYVAADRYTPFTTDAFVQAYVVQVAPQVGGQVIRVHVSEGDTVAKDALLFELDPRPFEHKVAVLEAQVVQVEHQIKQLDAQLAAAKAEQRQLAAEADYAREVHRQEEAIYKKESTTQRKYLDAIQKHKASDDARLDKSARDVQSIEEVLAARVGTEHALVAKAKAELAEAQLNLAYTKVHAPCAGTITNLQLREGAYAHVGQAVLACIDTRHWLVVANFRENCLTKRKVGQPAIVALQGLPGTLWPAHVRFMGSGVGQGQGIPSGMLPDVKTETRWIPRAQRFQVRLELDDPHDIQLRVGMTASVSVYVDSGHGLNSLTKAVHKILAWLYYLVEQPSARPTRWPGARSAAFASPATAAGATEREPPKPARPEAMPRSPAAPRRCATARLPRGWLRGAARPESSATRAPFARPHTPNSR